MLRVGRWMVIPAELMGIRTRAPAAPAPSPLLAGLVAYWRLEEESGDRVDATGGLPATEVGGSTPRAAGKVGYGASFIDASTKSLFQDWSETGNPFTNSFTVACWVFLDSTVAANCSIVTRYSVSLSWRQFALYYRHASGSFAWMTCTPTLNEFVTFGSNVKGAWHFVAGVYDPSLEPNGTLACYLDGTFFGPYAKIRPYPSVEDADGVRIGAAHDGFAAQKGMIDEVGLWNRVLLPAELDALYNGGVGVTYPFA